MPQRYANLTEGHATILAWKSAGKIAEPFRTSGGDLLRRSVLDL
jgi:hypothetical protein